MPFADTPLVAGTINWSSLKTNFDDFRTWVNAIPNGDLSNGAVTRENLVRPVILGFPVGGMWSTLQEGYQRDRGLDEHPAQQFVEWGSRRGRFPIVPYKVPAVDEVWRYPIGGTLRLYRNSDVEAHCRFEWIARTQTATYPTGAGAGDRCGYYAIHYFNRTTGNDIALTEGLHHVYADGVSWITTHDNAVVSMVQTLAAGVYDLQLCYHRNNCPETVHQLDVARPLFHVEVL